MNSLSSRQPSNRITSADLPALGVLLFIITAFSFLLLIQPNDYWWYVRLGDEILRDGVIPRVDTFTYTQAGQPMVYHSWLSAVLFAVAHRVGGAMLTVLLRGLLLAGLYACLWIICRKTGAGPILAAGLVLLAALISANNWAVRPQLFAFPLYGLTLLILWRWQAGQNRGLWLLPVLMLFWVNLHGSYVVGFLVVGAAVVGGGGERRALATVLVGMGLVSLLNPRLFGAWRYVATLLSDPPSQQLGAEWSPPTVEGWQGTLFFAWLLLLLPLASVSKSRLNLTQWLWLLGLGWMALSGLRYVIWFMAVLTPITALWLAPLINRLPRRRKRRPYPVLDLGFSLGLLLLSLAVLPGLRDRWWTAAPPVLSANTPVDGVAWLRENHSLPEHLWADLTFSSYLIYALPERPVWIDTRFELFPLAQWEDYIAISEAAPGWESRLLADEVSLVMIDPAMQPRLRSALDASPHWQEHYHDQTLVIYVRDTSLQSR